MTAADDRQRQLDFDPPPAITSGDMTWDEFLTRTYGPEKALFTFEEVCTILDCSRSSLYAMVGRRELEVKRIGSSPRVTRLSLLEYLRTQPPKKK